MAITKTEKSICAATASVQLHRLLVSQGGAIEGGAEDPTAEPLVFDGHGGSNAASFIRKTILKFIVEDSHFLVCLEKAIKTAFVKANRAFANDSSLDISSGTTTLTALIFG
ncbi:unnamed protein product, partial [Ilex paraguariensis]